MNIGWIKMLAQCHSQNVNIIIIIIIIIVLVKASFLLKQTKNRQDTFI